MYIPCKNIYAVSSTRALIPSGHVWSYLHVISFDHWADRAVEEFFAFLLSRAGPVSCISGTKLSSNFGINQSLSPRQSTPPEQLLTPQLR